MAYQDEDRFGRVSTVAKAALAVGAGAAFLYRGGGNQLLSKGLKRTTAALNDALPSLSSRTLGQMNGNAKQIFKESYDTFKESYNNYDDLKASLRLDNKRSSLNVLQLESQLRGNPNAFLRNLYNKEEFIPGIKRELNNRVEGLSSRRINTIVDDVTTHIADTLKNDGPLPDDYLLSDKFRKDYAGVVTDEQIQTIEDVFKEKFKAKRQETEAFMSARRDLIDNIQLNILDPDAMAENFGSTENQTKTQQFVNKLLGDAQATWKDVLDSPDQIEKTNLISDGNQDPQEILQRMRDLVNKDERYGNLYVDPTLRINKDGDIYSFAEAANIADRFENSLLHTLPGRLMKPLEERVYKKQSPNMMLSAKGSVDYLLPKLLEGRESTVLENSYLRLNNRGYKIQGNNLIRENKMDNLFLTSGQHGSYVRLYKNVTGDVDYSSKPRNALAEALDIGSTPKLSGFENFKAKFRKFKDPEWGPNLIKSKFDSISLTQMPDDYLQDMKDINRIFKRSTKSLDKTTVTRLNNVNQDKATREIFDLLMLDDENLLKTISTQKTGNTEKIFLNEDAISIINRYKKDPAAARNIVSIMEGSTNIGINSKYTKAESYTELLRKELSKEAMLRYKYANGGDALMSVLNTVPLNSNQRKNAKNIASWAIFQETGEVWAKEISPKRGQQLQNSQNALVNLFSGEIDTTKKDSILKQEFRDSIMQMAKDSASIVYDEAGATKAHLNQIEKANRPNNYVYVQKGISALDLIKDINNTEKIKSFGKQFTAGRKNMEDFTNFSFYPYFGLFRLTDAIPGLAFSPENTGNVLELAKNITMKRALPVVGAATAFSYLNYESRNLTGKSLTEAALNSYANFDLGIRTMIDKTPLGEHMKDMYYVNDAAHYYNDDPYRNAQEQKQWYESGVKSVRKGRWWGMSTSEFRGGKIEYFEPNKLRQASTPWRDIGIYGSSDEKWKHSLMPTLRYPLSPLRYLMNPYWLEEKNKFSRPYPMSAPMFGEGTPWSGILNMTVGEAIKPKRMMHKEILGNDFVDVRDLIARQNERIKSKEASSDSYIMLTDSNSATVERHFDLAGAPQFLESPIIGGDQLDLSKFNKESGTAGTTFSPVVNQRYGSRDREKITLKDRIVMATMDTGMVMPQLEDINARIIQKASTRGMSDTGYAKQYDSLVAADNIDLLRDKQISAELRNTTSTKEYIRDIGYSAKQIGGMYGFMFEEMIPSKRQHVLANATSMSSFSRGFWDESMGGLGGGVMEIARRFFPHANRNNIELNPIRNTMASWMPERFKQGDPYTKVKKGEMRLPGKAYEAMNNYTPQIDYSIHPYMIGASRDELVSYYMNKDNMDSYFNTLPREEINASARDIHKTEKSIQAARKHINKLIDSGQLNSGEFYNDYQRFKILADVAPYSDEYKIYKSKVRNQLNDYNRDEYNDILKRVEKQSKQHEFYNYRYLNKNFEETSGYVDKITNDGFTLVGSDKLYSLAGVKTTQEGIASQLSAGMKVNLKYDSLDKDDQYIKAVVTAGGENISKNIISSKLGERHTNGDAIDAHALASPGQKTLGMITEAIGHAPIPFVHNRYLKTETALESYKNEQVYGTPYATWSNPIQGYIEPAFNKAVAVSGKHAALGYAAFAANLYMDYASRTALPHDELIKKSVKIANAVVTPGAATGAVIGYGLKLSSEWADIGMKAGSAVWSVGYLATNANNPFLAVGAGASIGKLTGDFLKEGTGAKGAAIGAAIGAGISYLKNPDFSIKGMEKWKPKKTEKRWEMEEYFDRLNYIKYKGLYEKAAAKALKKEGVNIKSLITEMENAEKKKEKEEGKLLRYKQKLSNSYISNTEYGKGLMRRIDNQLVDPLESKLVRAGEYTKSAIAYKQAMDSTIYGLKENASWSQILRALPKNDRDYFMEFAKVKDKKEQDEILKTISPYKRKILQNMWGRDADSQESNLSYFSSHKLPGMFWEGWRPNVDMDHVQMKTIENEGMLLSDFGFYDSNRDEPGYQDVAPVRYDQPTNIMALKANLFSSLNGLGLTGVNVSIEPSQMPGIQMVADFARISDFKIKQKINSTFGRTYY